jgi:hypothetical protein
VKKSLVIETPAASGTGANPEPEIITSKELAHRVQVSEGTINNWRKLGKLAYISTPGRSIRFHWPTVRDNFLRTQRGGAL